MQCTVIHCSPGRKKRHDIPSQPAQRQIKTRVVPLCAWFIGSSNQGLSCEHTLGHGLASAADGVGHVEVADGCCQRGVGGHLAGSQVRDPLNVLTVQPHRGFDSIQDTEVGSHLCQPHAHSLQVIIREASSKHLHQIKAMVL